MSEVPVFRTIREQIADRIRADVLSGRLSEGTSLREQTLAKQYGVSRAPIRDALLQLTQEGLLVAKPNCGVKVGSPSGEEIQPLVIELRRKIEVFALRKVFGKLTEADIDRLDETVEQSAGRLPEGGPWRNRSARHGLASPYPGGHRQCRSAWRCGCRLSAACSCTTAAIAT